MLQIVNEGVEVDANNERFESVVGNENRCCLSVLPLIRQQMTCTNEIGTMVVLQLICSSLSTFGDVRLKQLMMFSLSKPS